MCALAFYGKPDESVAIETIINMRHFDLVAD